MAKTLTIRLADEQVGLIDMIMEEVGEKTASKAVLKAATLYLVEIRNSEALAELLEKRNSDVDRLKHTITKLDGLCRAVLEVTSQKDLLSN